MPPIQETSSPNGLYFPIASSTDQNYTQRPNFDDLYEKSINDDNNDESDSNTTQPIKTREDSIVLPIASTSEKSGNSTNENTDDSDFLYDLLTSGEIQGIFSDNKEEDIINTKTEESTQSWLFNQTRVTQIREGAIEEYTDPQYVSGTNEESTKPNIEWLYGSSEKDVSTRSITIEYNKSSTREIFEMDDNESTTNYNTLSLLKDRAYDDIFLIETSTLRSVDSDDNTKVTIGEEDNPENQLASTNDQNTVENKRGNKKMYENSGGQNYNSINKDFEFENDAYNINDDPTNINKSEDAIKQRDPYKSNENHDNSDNTEIIDTSKNPKNSSSNLVEGAENSERTENSVNITDSSFDSNTVTKFKNYLENGSAEDFTENLKNTSSDDSERNNAQDENVDGIDHMEELDVEQEIDENYVGNLKDDCAKIKNKKTRIYCKVYKCYNGILHECY